MKNFTQKSICLLLVLLLILQSLPLNAKAMGTIESLAAQENTQKAQTTVEKVESSRLSRENKALRDAYTKHFRNEDGSFSAAVYSNPVHYLKDGKWEDIDMSLQRKSVSGELSGTKQTATSDRYETLATDTPVSFPAQLNKNEYIAVSARGFDLQFKVVDSEKNSTAMPLQTEKQRANVSADIQEDTSMKSEVNSGTIVYEDVYDNTDLRYDTFPGRVKESIVINAAQSEYVYRFEMNLDGLQAVSNGDGSISLIENNDTDNPVFVIAVPYMFDADGEYSDDVTQSIVQNGTTAILTVTADADWINNENRQFPVTVDPTLLIDVGAAHTYDTYVNSALPTTALPYDNYVYVGKNLYGTARTYVKFDLPDLPDCSVVTNSVLTLAQNQYDPGNGAAAWIAAAIPAENWVMSQLTWNNQPAINSELGLVDYTPFHAGEDEYNYELNITKIVKQWYEYGNNYGLVLKSFDESTTKAARFYTSEYNYENGYPMFVVTYINNTGLEEYWSYETVDLGASGILYINNYNGALTYVHSDIALGGNILPLSLSHVFNSDAVNAGNTFGGGAKFGKGFRLNISECIVDIFSGIQYEAGYRAKLIDADGTVHYFYLTDEHETFAYENNENIILHYERLSYTYFYSLTFEDGSKRYYSYNGYLTAIEDTNGNTMLFTINNNERTLSITDGAGRVLTLNYNSGGYLTSVSVPSGENTTRIISYTYDTAGNLTKITYPDATFTKLFYDANGMLNRILAADTSDVLITYKTVACNSKNFYRVQTLTRRGTGSSETASRDVFKTITFDYRGSDTLITDEINGESVCVGFDNAGRAVSARNHEGDLAVSAYNSSGNLNNTLAYSSDSFRFSENLLQNSSFENGYTGWNKYISGSTGYTFHTLSEGTFSGNKAIALTRTVAGSAIVNQNFDNVTPGAEYTFSAYFKIVEELTSGNFDLSITVYNGDTSLFTVRSINYTLTDGWERAQVSVTLPAEATRFRVYASLRSGAIGTVLVDACQLEQSGAAGQYNMLQNPGMTRTTSAGAVADWTGVGSTALVTSSPLNGNAVSLTGSPASESYVYQDIPVNGTAGTTLVFGATAKGNAASGDDDSRSYCAEITLYNGSSAVGSARAEYDIFAIGTEQALVSSVKAESDFTSVRFKLLYGKQINTALFDNAYLYTDAFGTSYSYDEDGKLILSENDNGDAIGYTYNGPDLTKISYQKDGVEYDAIEYGFDTETHNILLITTADGIKTSYAYPLTGSKGQPIKITVSNLDGSLYSSVNYLYSDDYNYLLKETDDLGNEISYEYNTYLGYLTAIIDPKGNKTEYNYNSLNGELLSISALVGNSTVSTAYSYNENGSLETVLHNGFSYGFEYDTFGRTTKTTVAGQTLGTYAYNTDGTLLSMTYGNGVVHSYSYDSLDRITSESYNGLESYSYHYNAAGQLGRHEDYENNVTWLYGYDLVGRLTDVQATDGTRISYSYDDVNKTQSYSVSKNGTQLSAATYTYTDDGTPVSASISAQHSDIAYEYDSLKRLSSVSHDVNGETVSTNYAYQDGMANGSTTSLVSNIEYRYDGYDFGPHDDISYTYDANGNISTVQIGSQHIAYTYDELNRLVRENNQQINKTITYTYDNGGNILNKKEYAYTTGTLGTPTDTIVYTYDSVWKDKLLSYDGGATITYDAIGNPLTYNGYTFTWQKGRQLASASGNGNTITYKYGTDGLRIQKTVNGVTTEYTYMSGLLVSQTNGTDTLNFAYSADGVPRSVNYNGTDYYYLYNLQGDVIAIYDRNGNTCVKYVYDSWGKVVSTTGTLASSLGAKNPFRYRGYYYDTETGFYYLTTRYYDPATGRFLNADGYISTGHGLTSFNMFAYCLNNPVNYKDANGCKTTSLINTVKNVMIVVLATSYIADYAEKTGGNFLNFVDFVGRITLDNPSLGEFAERLIVAVYVLNGSMSWSALGDASDLLDDIGSYAELLIEKFDMGAFGYVLTATSSYAEFMNALFNPLLSNTDFRDRIYKLVLSVGGGFALDAIGTAIGTALNLPIPAVGTIIGFAAGRILNIAWDAALDYVFG